MRKGFSPFLLLATALFGAACQDEMLPTTPASIRPAAAAQAGSPLIREPELYPAFDLELSASGSMQPGKPIQLHVRAKANLPVADAEVTIVAPDFEAARMSGFGADYTVPQAGTKIPALLKRRQGWAAGESQNYNTALTTPAPGYYRVVASVVAHSELPRYAGDTLKVARETFREIWLRVDRRGGRSTLKFDTAAMPQEAEARPGPMRCHVSIREERQGRKRDPGCDGAAVIATISDCNPGLDGSPIDCESPCTYDPNGCTDPCAEAPALCAPGVPPLQPLPFNGFICGVGPYYAEYFAGTGLEGTPHASRCEAGIRNDWEYRAPVSGVGPDNFSVRWTGWQTLGAGTYTFTARADDGVRLWVDGELLIDQWRDQAETNFRVRRELAGGTHHIRMEYYERSGSAAAQLSIAGGTSGSDPCFNNSSRCYQFMYYHAYNERYEPAPEGMRVKASYQDRDCSFGGWPCWWNEESHTYLRADAEGRVIVRCPASSDEKRLRSHHEFLDEYVAVGLDEWLGPEAHGCATGWDRVEIVPNREAYVYGNMRRAGQRALELFGRSSSRVRVDFDAWPESTSWYNMADHHISIVDESIWAWDAVETHGHEYGHAYHSRALGGIAHIYVSGSPRHTFNQDGTGDKALLEGFAHFFSTLVLPGTRGTGYFVRHPERWAPEEFSLMPVGRRVEARVAAYLWDLVDDEHEKGSGHEYDRGEIAVAAPYFWGTHDYRLAGPEGFDEVRLPPAFVGSVLVTCREADGGQPEDILGIDQCVKGHLPTEVQMAVGRVWYHDIYQEMP